MKKLCTLVLLFVFIQQSIYAQINQALIEQITNEAEEHSQLEQLAFELVDWVGPRLVGSPGMDQAAQWAIDKFASWGVTAEKQNYGTWRGWERGITHIDLIEPRVRTLSGMQLAWSAPTPKKGITAEVITLPENIQDSLQFARWLPTVKGKLVMVSMPQFSGRPEYNWKEFATEESFKKFKEDEEAHTKKWNDMMRKTGYNSRTIDQALEAAGAVGIIQSYWSKGFGANKIFGARAKNIPTIDLQLEDYGLVYRLAQNGKKPVIRLQAESKDLGEVPAFNTIATIPGNEKADEYIILSAHFDSWDGSGGVTDNATGVITMMEVVRILKKYYPNPKRTIIVGLWGGEEQGLNGSRAFVEDHPEIVQNVHVVFNQDNGTGRVHNINGQGFLHSYAFWNRWLQDVPQKYKSEIKTTFPGTPSGGGSDHSSFVAYGAPAFMLSSLNWSYWNYTWHTNLDTYDKIVFDDVKNNVALIAILTYLASEDEEKTSRERSVLPINNRTGSPMEWPEPRKPNRKGGLD